MPDRDVAMINANNPTTAGVTYKQHLGNILMAMTVHPTSGEVYVVGTDATNEVRFEPNLRGKFLRVNVSRFAPAGSPLIADLNPHINYSTHTSPPVLRIAGSASSPPMSGWGTIPATTRHRTAACRAAITAQSRSRRSGACYAVSRPVLRTCCLTSAAERAARSAWRLSSCRQPQPVLWATTITATTFGAIVFGSRGTAPVGYVCSARMMAVLSFDSIADRQSRLACPPEAGGQAGGLTIRTTRSETASPMISGSNASDLAAARNFQAKLPTFRNQTNGAPK
jgi:hypothetical protein